ncbi:MAG TPA: hypothetical protein VFS40_04265, partial [Gemmatimonadales bacterium]|nr:hypothetical protein [Gemmatimonadales bacterium]
MAIKLHSRARARFAAAVLAGTAGLALGAPVLRGQVAAPPPRRAPCPAASGAASEAGWTAYRGGAVAEARARFAEALRLCAANQDAAVGLGYVALREGRVPLADSLFRAVVARDSANADGWDGLARAAWRQGDGAAARAAARRALALNPRNADARALLDRLDPDWNRPALVRRPRPATLQLVARTTTGTRERPGGFEVAAAGGGWTPFYVRGVNLGVALPGKFPSEFPTDSAVYAGWLDTLAAMHANTVRVYTILPPAFYRALRAWNLAHPARPLWLVHGVWTELPPRDDFDDPAWKDEFRAEMRRVVDLLHGQAELAPRPGHAAGRYDADVSRWTLAYILGREWEPYAVQAFDARAGGSRPYHGRYLQVAQGPAMDVWMAEQCDYLLAYEADTYNALRPIAYTNWPTLDPLTHPTEAGTREEAAWRRKAGRPSEAPKLEYENDAIALDANLVRPTAANPAGWFASYHAYPYYPDFMVLDPGYLRARSSEGPSTYYGYLAELVRHHAGLPVLVAEYGVPSSRGLAHLQPQGWHHGGHDETVQAAIDARLTREIREAGAAGSIVFAWLDEWFKKNWVVIDFEIPLERTRLWHNVMDAEQNYGILGAYAGAASGPAASPAPGGDPARWLALRVVQEAREGAADERARQDALVPARVRMGSDASYVFVAVEFPGLRGRAFPWDSAGVQLALDTHLPRVGQHLLPRTGVRSELGFEFLADLRGPGAAALRVTPEYNRYAALKDPATGDDYGRFYHRPVTITDRADGRFDALFVITNRARYGRDGTFFPARGRDRGVLRFGRAAESSLSDWWWDAAAGLLELRLPWDLLNVTDPSSRTLLFDPAGRGDFGTAPAGAFHVGVVSYRVGPGGAGAPRDSATVVATLPASWRADAFADWTWAGWEEPVSHLRLKPVYDSLR